MRGAAATSTVHSSQGARRASTVYPAPRPTTCESVTRPKKAAFEPKKFHTFVPRLPASTAQAQSATAAAQGASNGDRETPRQISRQMAIVSTWWQVMR